MKISLDWLGDFVTWEADPEELAERLTCLGLNVEGIDEYRQAFPGVVVGRVLSAEPHPDADRLSLCTVHDGRETFEVVCGAPNVRTGLHVLFARPGAVLPGNLRIKKTRIRGAHSAGMICSGKELQLSAEADFIMELAEDAVPGTPADELHGHRDVVLDLEVTPNRPDWLCHLGVAREVAALFGVKVTLPPFWSDQHGSGEALDVGVEIENFADCPRYTAHGVRRVVVGPAPGFIQNRLRAIGSRPINNVVDITNYVLFELGQPLHAFDRARLDGTRLFVRRARPGERLTTLDGVDRELSAVHLVIADRAGPVALAGVMGGLGSQVEAGTEDLVLESAFFNPLTVRRSGRSLGVVTDSSYRFEREADWGMVEKAAKRALYLLQKHCGALVLTDWTDRQDPDRRPAPDLPLRVAQVNRLLGTRLDSAATVRLLQCLGLKVIPLGKASDGGGANLMVQIPSFRRDLGREVDLIEEVARLHGYDLMPRRERFRAGAGGPRRPWDRAIAGIRHHLCGAGFQEVATSSFGEPADQDRLRLGKDDRRRPTLQVVNPKHGGEVRLRTSLLPSFLRVARHNLNVDNPLPVKLFQVNKVFWPSGGPRDPGPRDDEKLLPCEADFLQFGIAGFRAQGSGGAPGDLLEIKGVLETLAAELRIGLRLEQAEDEPYLDRGQQWRILDRAGRRLGGAGAVDPAVLADFEIELPVAVAEIDLSLADLTPDPVVFQPFSRFPAVKRDLSFLVPDGVRFAEVDRTVRAAAGPFLESLELFDIYRGKGLAEGVAAVGIRLKFRSIEGNLKGKTVDKALSQIKEALAENLDVHIRS